MTYETQGALLRSSAATAILAFCFGQAHAATYDLSLFGAANSASSGSFNSGNTHYDYWNLSLTGLDASNAIKVAVGDTINAKVTLDHAVTIPASVDLTWFTFILGGSSFPAIDTGTIKNAVAFSNLGLPGLSGSDSNCTTSGNFSSCNLFRNPDNPPITFDQAIMSLYIDTLGTTTGQTVTLDSAAISYTLFSPTPVPEPETYAMLIAGLGLLGTIARRRKSKASPSRS